MKKLFAFTLSVLIFPPAASAYADSYIAIAAAPNAAAHKMISQLGEQFVAPSTAPQNIYQPTPAAASLCQSACANAYLSPSPFLVRAAVGSKTGNVILQNLPTLFVLDSLFKNSSNGVLSQGPTSLSDVLILYQIFFTPIPRY